ncbi:hypothetical protein Xbud_03178 [Xenorhabdus budapestensis]|uniref:Uncharacterized protein n=1 Tax=Xenorhabdus budapestensis TaxID=290110 RepID=A0A2D0ISE8_XENBU|nr:hypothetical protein Xbud_03178 [Xenorhabdus budapestensis]
MTNYLETIMRVQQQVLRQYNLNPFVLLKSPTSIATTKKISYSRLG